MAKILLFLANIRPLIKAIAHELCERFFSSAFSFCKINININENVSITDHAFGIRLPDCSKLTMNEKII